MNQFFNQLFGWYVKPYMHVYVAHPYITDFVFAIIMLILMIPVSYIIQRFFPFVLGKPIKKVKNEKICFVNYDMSVTGGVEQVTTSLANALCSDYEVFIYGISVRGKLYLINGIRGSDTGQSFPRTAGSESVLQAFFLLLRSL